MPTTDYRDRELISAKNKVPRLEARIQELEGLLENQAGVVASPVADLSLLRHDLSESRKRESVSLKREADLKTKTRDLQAQIVGLERELHEAHLAQFKSKSPSVSPRASNSTELAQLREDLVHARSQLKDARTHIHNLERSARKVSVDETERADLHALLKSSSIEAEALALKLSDRDSQLNEMNVQLKRLRHERGAALRKTDDVTRELDSQLGEMKAQLQRLREEKGTATRKAEVVSRELDSLQARYEGIVDKMHSGKIHGEGARDMEMKGLMKEVVWLKARYKREEAFRLGLAWSKDFAVTEDGLQPTWYASVLDLILIGNESANHLYSDTHDLKILRQVGIHVPSKTRHGERLAPVQKLRAGVFAVMATIRMRKLEQQWRGVRMLGDELKRLRSATEGRKDKERMLGKWINAALVN